MFRDIIGDIKKFVNESLMLVTALSPINGYDKASAIAYQALDQSATLRDAALNGGFVSADEFDRIVDPKRDSLLPPDSRSNG